MKSDLLPEIVSSRMRLRIADLISIRPRTLGELAESTGISIQGVLRHVRQLEKLGLLEVKKVKTRELNVRRLYAPKRVRIGDYSSADLTVVKLSEVEAVALKSKDPAGELEYLAEEALIGRRKIRDQVKKLGRMIDDLVDNNTRLEGLVRGVELTEEERLVLEAAFTEETMDDGIRVLWKHYGVKDGRRSIDRALAKAKRSAKK